MNVPHHGWLVFHADDLGLAYGFNEAIRAAHLHGNITSTCLQTAGIAYRHALNEVLPDCPRLGVGVHVNLVECRSILPPRLIPDLVDADGVFRGYRPQLTAVWNRRIRTQIRDESRAQIERALEDGVALDHLNSHRHTHMLPRLFEMYCELAADYSIPFIRMVCECFHLPRPIARGAYYLHEANWAKMLLMNALARRNRRRLLQFDLRCNDAFVGLSYTGRGSEHALMAALAANTPRARGDTSPTRGDATGACFEWARNEIDVPVVEALVHLARPGDARDHGLPPSVATYCDHPARLAEQAAAESNDLRQAIENQGMRLTNYRELAGRGAPPGEAQVDAQVRTRETKPSGPRWRPVPVA